VVVKLMTHNFAGRSDRSVTVGRRRGDSSLLRASRS
jgi:hypothetical protein